MVNTLGQTSVAHLGKAQDAFECKKRVFDLGAVDLFIPLSQWRVAVSGLIGEIFGLGRFGMQGALLSSVGAADSNSTAHATILKSINERVLPRYFVVNRETLFMGLLLRFNRSADRRG